MVRNIYFVIQNQLLVLHQLMQTKLQKYVLLERRYKQEIKREKELIVHLITSYSYSMHKLIYKMNLQIVAYIYYMHYIY